MLAAVNFERAGGFGLNPESEKAALIEQVFTKIALAFYRDDNAKLSELVGHFGPADQKRLNDAIPRWLSKLDIEPGEELTDQEIIGLPRVQKWLKTYVNSFGHPTDINYLSLKRSLAKK